MEVFTFFERRWRKSLKKNRGHQQYILLSSRHISYRFGYFAGCKGRRGRPCQRRRPITIAAVFSLIFFVLFVIVSHPHNKLLERNLKENFFPQFDFCIVLQLKKSQSSDLSDWTLISTYGSTLCSTCIYVSLSLSLCVCTLISRWEEYNNNKRISRKRKRDYVFFFGRV